MKSTQKSDLIAFEKISRKFTSSPQSSTSITWKIFKAELNRVLMLKIDFKKNCQSTQNHHLHHITSPKSSIRVDIIAYVVRLRHCCYIIYMFFLVLYCNDDLRFKFESLAAAIHRKRTAGRLIEPIIPLLQKPGNFSTFFRTILQNDSNYILKEVQYF